MNANTLAKAPLEIPSELLNALRDFPRSRSIIHCGETNQISPFDIYLNCPKCGQRIKVRSFAGVTEIEDVFDAVFEWLNDPQAREYAEERQQVLAEDEGP